MALNETVIDGVMNANFKNVAEMPAIAAGLSSQNAVSHQQALNLITQVTMMESMLQRAGTDPTEAKAMSTIMQSDLGAITAQLGTVTAALQVLAKMAQTTPPPTTGT